MEQLLSQLNRVLGDAALLVAILVMAGLVLHCIVYLSKGIS